MWGTLQITFHENLRLSKLRKALIVRGHGGGGQGLKGRRAHVSIK